jgi:hypothetical protein
VNIIYHVCYPDISIESLNALSHHLSHTIGFTMVDPPGVVRRKPILVQMYTHDFLVLHSPVTTLAAGTQKPFSGI